jgi:hypothetical protein
LQSRKESGLALSKQAVRLACPFYARAKRSHNSCLAEGGFANFNTLQTHLFTAHYRLFYCPICSMTFEHSTSRFKHIRDGTCKKTTSRAKVPAGLSSDQVNSITALLLQPRREEKDKMTDTWKAIFKILFPGEQPPSSPYLGGSDLEDKVLRLREFWSRKGKGLVSKCLNDKGLLKWDTPDEESGLNAVYAIVRRRLLEDVVAEKK